MNKALPTGSHRSDAQGLMKPEAILAAVCDELDRIPDLPMAMAAVGDWHYVADAPGPCVRRYLPAGEWMLEEGDHRVLVSVIGVEFAHLVQTAQLAQFPISRRTGCVFGALGRPPLPDGEFDSAPLGGPRVELRNGFLAAVVRYAGVNHGRRRLVPPLRHFQPHDGRRLIGAKCRQATIILDNRWQLQIGKSFAAQHRMTTLHNHR